MHKQSSKRSGASPLVGWSTGEATQPHDHRVANPDNETLARRKKAAADLRKQRERAAVQVSLKRFAALLARNAPLPSSMDELPLTVRPEVERAGGLVPWALGKWVVKHFLRTQGQKIPARPSGKKRDQNGTRKA
ncbi:hypothetical protein OKC48_07715 [Methylorubrum extorquens]|uniref:hypothetical protein n=1 Tax=Methylorubrum extorquens TaxID=408 RepID=UPI0022372E49|nr:hypothetical protein [Methylorubrum extorquens]UYW28392.1 hypothetical protein OKC48_07715 [Methylorubrum extorquens]